MKSDYSLKRLFINNSYLLLTAAFFFTLSFVIDNYWSDTSSAKVVTKKLATYILQQENDFDNVAGDTALIKDIVNKKYNEQQLKTLAEKKYFLFVYSKSDSGLHNMVFWNNQVIEPDDLLLFRHAKEGFIQLSNGFYVWRKKNTANSIV